MGTIRPSRMLTLTTGLFMAMALVAVAAPPPKRARPPRFPKAIEDAFFPNAREKLVGPRPQAAKPSPESPASVPQAARNEVSAGSRTWSRLITAEAVEDEIKTQQRKLSASVESATAFKGGAYRNARTSLSLLATFFALDAKFDEKMRWQPLAATMRDATARAGFNCKVGTDASYQEARKVAEELENLIRGGSAPASEAAAETGWDKIADRAPLMKRLEQSQEQGFAPWTANSGDFAKHAEGLSHEAQLVAALAEVIQQPSYELADDETYREYAQTMQAQALAVREAVEQKNYAAARTAAGEVSKACAACHEGYRN